MRAVVYQHEEHEGLGVFAEALAHAGFSLQTRFRSARHEDVNADLVVVMGGSMGVYEAEAHPFLREELAVVAERLGHDRPCLGICLGAQILAAATGAEVFPGKNGMEVGVGPVRWTQAALEDPVLAGVRARSTVAHWHQDTFRPVPSATLLASTDRYTQQGFRLGSSYAFQFHVELTASALAEWLTLGAEELGRRGLDVAELSSQLPKLKAGEPELRALVQRLAAHFAKAAGGPRG